MIFGNANPAGRLPVTFYRSVSDLPPFVDYDMKGRTYRYFEGQPLYPFGHGLSYTRFEYLGLSVDKTRVQGERPARCRHHGAETAVHARETKWCSSTCVSWADAADADPVASRLRAGAAAPGEKRQVRFMLTPAEDFAYYDETKKRFVVQPAEYEIGRRRLERRHSRDRASNGRMSPELGA